jgi:hypothetical protein
VQRKLLLYRLSDLAAPRELAVLADPHVLRVGRRLYWHSERDPPGRERFQVLDAAGIREPSPSERAELDALHEQARPAAEPGGPATVAVERHVSPEPIFGSWPPPVSELTVDDRVVVRRRDWAGAIGQPRWHPALQLYTWEEHGRRSDRSYETFVMDAQGRHRPWRQGFLVAVVPRR